VRKRTRVDEPPPLFECDPYSGIDSNSQSFTTEDCKTQFTAHAKASIVHLVPYAPVNLKDEKSCFALLLLYISWPNLVFEPATKHDVPRAHAWDRVQLCREFVARPHFKFFAPGDALMSQSTSPGAEAIGAGALALTALSLCARNKISACGRQLSL
jgi:hypothetical protein